MEMNTRLQVEHPVTEAVTGLDLVEWQFRIAAGEKLPLAQHQVRLDGHAVEARLYAEDPEREFLPSTGRLIALRFPRNEGLRVDSGVEAGSEVSPFYDPMIAKLIVHAKTRDEALESLAGALEETVLVGPRSNAGFLAALCRAQGFRKGQFDTGFIERNLVDLGAVPRGLDGAAAALGAETLLAHERDRLAALPQSDPDQPASPWDASDAFQLSGRRHLALPVLVDDQAAVAEVAYDPPGLKVLVEGSPPAKDATVVADGDAIYVLRHGRQTKVALRDLVLNEAGDHDVSGIVRAPMHGKVLHILVEPGAQVIRGQRLAIIEAMKMEHTLVAPTDGTVTDLSVAADAQVAEGAPLMRVVPSQETRE
jgi:3-methylcrotonyl-CoA carboxylase alpha subunit